MHVLSPVAAILIATLTAPLVPQRPHWSFVPPVRPDVPDARAAAWSRNPIDGFVDRRLREAGLRPSPRAEVATLVRRVYLDLIGLPPTPEQIDAFAADRRPDAWARLVDELLASPHHGERWGRHWLDAARYADSNGYSIDGARSIWKYRDWVVDALNRDIGFDRFTVLQIAGDLVEDATLADRIATGFHRNTMVNQEGGVDREEFRIEAVKDRVATTATVWLGLSIGCAQCHDHKYDPVSQREFYELYAFFNDDDEVAIPVGTEDEIARRAAVRAQVDALQRELKAYEKTLAAADRGRDLGRRERRRNLDALRKNEPKLPTTLVLRARGKPRTSHLHVRGDFTRKGAVVEPGTPAVLHAWQRPDRRPTRLDLARWLVDPRNPLTARVTVNRIWQRYFGVGLVATENDFGTRGAAPSHPALLDWLATELVRRDWSLESIHRLIATSETYRQASRRRAELDAADADNRLLGRQRRLRLDAEVIRDVALAASGLLSRKLGGPPVYPPQPPGVTDLGQTKRPWRTSRGEDRHRRGLYTWFWRATPHPAFQVFDAPSALETCTRRDRSNTPLQALTLLNDPAFFEMAEALGRRLRDVAAGDEHRLGHGFRLCVGRSPTARERGLLRAALARLRECSAADAEVWTQLARVLLNLDETITRE